MTIYRTAFYEIDYQLIDEERDVPRQAREIVRRLLMLPSIDDYDIQVQPLHDVVKVKVRLPIDASQTA